MTVHALAAAPIEAESPHPDFIPSLRPAHWGEPIVAQPSVERERLYRKQRLAVGYRLFARNGYDMGGAGHITVRDPEHPDRFWVNPAGVHFGHIRVSDLMLVDHTGEILQWGRIKRLNQAAFAIHAQLHKARPDVVAAAHSHSLYGKAWSSLGRLLDPLTQDACAFYEGHAVFEEFSGVVLEASEGEKIAAVLGPTNKAVILQNHGLLTVAPSVEAAVWRYIALENACHAQLLAEAAGRPKPVPPEIARKTAGQMGSDAGGWFAFQPYLDLIAAEEPDVFD